MMIYFKRIFKIGIINFWRNRWITLATVMVMVLMLFVTGSLVFSSVLLSSSIDRIEKKVDISVYFTTHAAEKDIVALQDELNKFPQVESVEYISREQALENFKLRHTNNALITQSLEELGENPLGASLNVQAQNPEQYESIAKFLGASSYSGVIDKINYFQNKLVIERLSNILVSARAIGWGAALVLAGIVVLVAFNTIRMAIFTSREEIHIMRLVGAENNYIRGPFVIVGVLYGIVSAVITMVFFYPLTLWLGPKAEGFFGGPNLFHYFIGNFFQIFLLLLAVGVALGAISSIIAVRKHLTI
ncbi:MAG: permease-like cell division protein FtsX [bacterium]|nr:permease-like cell division protein FtsX [bacterium]